MYIRTKCYPKMNIDFKVTHIVKGMPLPPAGALYMRVESGVMFRVLLVRAGLPEEKYKEAAEIVAKEMRSKGSELAVAFAQEKIRGILEPPKLKWWVRLLKFVGLWKN